uniref:HABP4_PAI-RBP1 domain-containing protein n=1 Tax=Meloidogyne hapla TaxID=6305 RepID=A0A1I8BQN1_MELHA
MFSKDSFVLAPPNVREDQPRAAGVGVGLDYQTLGNLDKNIFVKGQKQKEGGKAKTTPSVPAQDQKPPAGVDEVPQKEGLAAGGDYQTMADIDQNVFGAKGGDAGAPPPPAAAPGGPGPSSQTSQKEAAPKEGIGQGADYQTWNNLDQNVFAKKDGAKSSADKKSAAGAGSGSQKEAAPKEGIGAGADYQTWNSMDKDVFLKGKKPDDDKKSAAGKGSEASKAEEAPRAGIGQGQDYQTWNALDKDVFVKK